MKTKICSKCNEEKSLKDFCYIKKRKWFSSWCKKCKKILNKNINKSKPWLKHLYSSRKRCVNPNTKDWKDYGDRGIQCLITEEELKTLWFRDKAYEMKQPSIDRIDNDGNYCFENCRFLELKENTLKRNLNYGKPILQYDLNGNLIKEWFSAKTVQNELGIPDVPI